jgi:hypothetical protein
MLILSFGLNGTGHSFTGGKKKRDGKMDILKHREGECQNSECVDFGEKKWHDIDPYFWHRPRPAKFHSDTKKWSSAVKERRLLCRICRVFISYVDAEPKTYVEDRVSSFHQAMDRDLDLALGKDRW